MEKLAKGEAELAQLRKSIEHKVELFIKAHNKLFSIAVQQHFAVLGDYLPEHAARLSIQPLANATPGGCYDKSGALLDTPVMTGLVAAEAQFHAQAAGIFTSIAEDMENGIKSFERQRDERLGKERDLKNKQRNLDEIEGEIKELTASIEAQDNLGRKADEEAGAAGKSVTEFDEKLKAYSNVERGLEEQRNLKDQNTDGHAKHLGAKPSADRLDQRQQALRASSERRDAGG